jgi:outer membrane protein
LSVRRPLVLLLLLLMAGAAGAQANLPAAPSVPQSAAPPAQPPARLTLKDAEALAARNNPLITVGKLTALASQQVLRETRSAYWPTAVVDVTGVDAQANSRITAGSLNNPIIYPRAAAGTIVSQLITDFGRTRNLVASSSFHAKAENENAVASALQIRLAVDQAFYDALQTRAVLEVAQQTVAERQTVTDQVQALFNSKLKSSLDLSFAQVTWPRPSCFCSTPRTTTPPPWPTSLPCWATPPCKTTT